jgi:predicted acyl esterase
MSSQSPTPYAEWPDPAAARVTLSFTGNGLETGQLTMKEGKRASLTLVDNATISASTLMNAASSPHRLLFKTPPLLSPIRISGTPTIQLTMAFGKPKANLTAHLISYPAAGGNGTVISRGWIDPENQHSPAVTEPITVGKFYKYTFDFQPKDSVLAAGRQLGIMILSSDRDYTIRPAPGTELTMDLKESKVRLPIVGGPSTFTNAFDW